MEGRMAEVLWINVRVFGLGSDVADSAAVEERNRKNFVGGLERRDLPHRCMTSGSFGGCGTSDLPVATVGNLPFSAAGPHNVSP